MFKLLKIIIVDWCLSRKTISAEELHAQLCPETAFIDGPDGELKFIEKSCPKNLFVQTDIGYSKVKHSFKTVKYQKYSLELEDGKTLDGADNHIVMDNNHQEVFLKDLSIGDSIKTSSGASCVKSIIKTEQFENMYDLELDDERHVFYTNEILSHNTQTISIYLLWYCLFHEDKTALVASKNNALAMEVLDRIRFAYEELPHWLKAGCKYYNKHEIVFDNGSRIKSEATTEKTGRGLAISMLYLDELAFINPRIQTALWASLAPTLSTGGKAFISSTPNGDTDLFASLWRGANTQQNAFIPVFVPWNLHPERGEEYLKKMQGELGPTLFRQEVLCEFLSSEAMLMDSAKMANIKPKIHLKENMGFRFWKDDDDLGGKGKSYLIGLDPATGNGNDFTVIEVIEYPSMEQVIELRSNVMNVPLIYAKLKWLVAFLTRRTPRGQADVIWTFERNGVGEALVALIQNDDDPRGGVYIDHVELYNEKDTRLGCFTTGKTKLLGCMQLKNLIEKINGGIILNSKDIHFELSNFISSKGTYKARPGSTDDTIMALVLIMKLITRLASYDDNARKMVYESVDPDSDLDDVDLLDTFGDEPAVMVF